MKTFIGVFHQENGCDYTIGCGTRVVRIEAEDMDQAVAMLSRDDGADPCLGYFGRHEDADKYVVDTLEVYEVVSHRNVDVKAAFDKLEE